jgi:hypothetical protein
MLHITNGEATKMRLEPSGVPGEFLSWDDVLHEGRTPLASGEEWWRVRAHHLGSAGYGSEEEMLRHFRDRGDPLDAARRHDEVVFWFEHDLYDQLLLLHHLWWLSNQPSSRTRYSIVIGAEIWGAYCGDDPGRLVPVMDRPDVRRLLPYVPGAMRRLLEEFPAVGNGLARSERQILDVLSEGPRSPEQAFVAAARLEEDIWMGDWPFWSIVKRLAAGPHPLVTLEVRDVPGRLPSGMVTITGTGRRVLAGGADHLALNAPSRWIGGTFLSPERPWRWTGSSLQPPAP